VQLQQVGQAALQHAHLTKQQAAQSLQAISELM
jgi:hypothetical protein